MGIQVKFDLEIVYNKLRNGDHLTDFELAYGIEQYEQAEGLLRSLGPRFHLAWAEVNWCLMNMRYFKHNRVETKKG